MRMRFYRIDEDRVSEQSTSSDGESNLNRVVSLCRLEAFQLSGSWQARITLTRLARLLPSDDFATSTLTANQNWIQKGNKLNLWGELCKERSSFHELVKTSVSDNRSIWLNFTCTSVCETNEKCSMIRHL